MTHILVECPALIASVRVGVLEPLQPLVDNGQCDVRFKETMAIKQTDIAWCDIFVSVRGSDYVTLQIVKAAKVAKRFVIYFLDDDLLGVPEGYGTSKYYSDKDVRNNIVQIISLADTLWAVNRRVLEKYGQWCPRQVLSKVPTTILREAQHNTQEMHHVLFAGSSDHAKMIREKVTPVARRLLREYPGKVDFTFIGVDPKLPAMNGIKCYPYFDSYEDYQKVLLEGNFDIGLAPGVRTEFFSCKYYNKYIEYSTYGIAGVYENCPPFTEIVRAGENGLLCEGSSEDWYEVLRNVIEGGINVQLLAENAQKLLRHSFSHEAIASLLTEAVPELVSYKAPFVNAKKIKLAPTRQMYITEKIKYYWRNYGLLSAVIIPFKAIRKICRFVWQKVSV